MWSRRSTNSSGQGTPWWMWSASILSANFTARVLLCLLCAVCLMLFTGCSQTVSQMPMPQLPANLALDCPKLPTPPKPAIDPERAVWELDLIGKYEDCALRHRMAVKAVNSVKK